MNLISNLFLITLFAITCSFTISAMQIDPSSPKASRFAEATQDKTQDKQDKDELGQQLIKAAENGNVQETKQLIQSGADVNAKTNFGDTALTWAAFNGRTEIIKLLIEKGVDINTQDNNGKTALMWAALMDRTEAMKLLIENGANINAKNNYGQTALMQAAFEGNTEAVKLLIENGADINAQDNDGDTALTSAAQTRAAQWIMEPSCELLVEAMKAQEGQPTLCFLFCYKKAKGNGSILQYLPKDIAQLIAKRCWNERTNIREEINKIKNENIKQQLLDKYFPETKK